jgi:hypothetical protein
MQTRFMYQYTVHGPYFPRPPNAAAHVDFPILFLGLGLFPFLFLFLFPFPFLFLFLLPFPFSSITPHAYRTPAAGTLLSTSALASSLSVLFIRARIIVSVFFSLPSCSSTCTKSRT